MEGETVIWSSSWIELSRMSRVTDKLKWTRLRVARSTWTTCCADVDEDGSSYWVVRAGVDLSQL
ncbi:hypothetical protein A2U01_0022774 [Trifolium medium]|uniref:Uncharacterized protein n=1 Tax=Trifolium medium TaxID=97028 RepID=A0A392NRQ0_9FABA|nr:hypothetical protein [Trifolium medium]